MRACHPLQTTTRCVLRKAVRGDAGIAKLSLGSSCLFKPFFDKGDPKLLEGLEALPASDASLSAQSVECSCSTRQTLNLKS